MFADYILFLSFILCLVSLLYFSTKKPNNFPPGPKWYPILGSFPQFKQLMNSTKDLALTFDILSKQYNSNVIGLKLGSQNVVVVFSPKLAKHIFLDDNYLGRPENFFNRLRTFGTTRGITSTNGKSWAVQRNFVVKHLYKVGYGKKTTEIKITSEIQEAMKLIDSNPVDVDFRKLLSLSVINVLWALVAGIKMSRDDTKVERLLELMHKRTLAFDMSGNTLNYFPWMRFLAPEKIGYNLITDLNAQLKEIFSETIENHVSTWTEGKSDDLMNAYISEIKKTNEPNDDFNYEQLQVVCLDLFFGGLTVTSTAIDFAFFAMAIHQDVQTKVQKVLDEAFDHTAPLEYSDRNKVPYVEAVICEIGRCYRTTPVIAPRAPIEDAVLNGYIIPQGTSIFLSFNSIFTNSEYFDEPDVFRPERFLNSNEELISNEAFFPFGLGKRKCLGDILAKMSQFLFFSEIIRNYKIYPMDEAVIEEEKFIPGMIRLKKRFPIKLVKRF